MCEYCHQYKCPSGCPNADYPALFAECEECGTEIYEGDEYYEIAGQKFCEACVLGGYKTAEID